VSPWRMRRGRAERTILREGVWGLGETEVSSTELEACDCKKRKKERRKSINELKLQKIIWYQYIS